MNLTLNNRNNTTKPNEIPLSTHLKLTFNRSYWQKVIEKIRLENNTKLTAQQERNYARERFYFDSNFPHIYFTRREVEFAMHLNHQTYQKIAMIYGVSVRTVEFYLMNMKRKLNCQSKTELVQLLDKHGFYDYQLKEIPV